MQSLTMRLSGPGSRGRQTKLIYPDHRLPPWPFFVWPGCSGTIRPSVAILLGSAIRGRSFRRSDEITYLVGNAPCVTLRSLESIVRSEPHWTLMPYSRSIRNSRSGGTLNRTCC